MKVAHRMMVGVGVFAVALGGCDEEAATEQAHAHEEMGADVASNRIAVPASVRSNLGITFVEAERRRVASTIRVPGRFEFTPTARRSYGPMLAGRVELLVSQFDEVREGDVLFRIDSPEWRQMQQDLAEATSSIERLRTRLESFGPLRDAHRRHERSLQDTIAVWEDRVGQLEAVRDAGGGRIEDLANARAALAAAKAELASMEEKDAELDASASETEAGLTAATSRLSFLLATASAILNVERAGLDDGLEGSPTWTTVDRIEVHATGSGVVESIDLVDGSWAEPRSPVLTVTQRDLLRFRASGLQSDLGALRDGLGATIVPPTPTTAGRAVPIGETMSGVLRLGLSGDANERTVDLFVEPEGLRSWARAGVSAHLEIVTDESERVELAVPLAAVQRDGLTPVLFVRDGGDPNTVIRLEADLGIDDGRWVEVRSGLVDGDQVVLDGAFQLMLATSGSIQKGGHFHADGTFHEGED